VITQGDFGRSPREWYAPSADEGRGADKDYERLGFAVDVKLTTMRSDAECTGYNELQIAFIKAISDRFDHSALHSREILLEVNRQFATCRSHTANTRNLS
jgi:hypothetical protein